ncbi:MAG: hypothetical protein GY725_05075 [bacterium]|nr:hypothetical protein [bacterium]
MERLLLQRLFGRPYGGLIAVLAMALGFACSGSPPWFEVVSLEQASQMLGDPKIALVDAVSDGDDQPGPLPGGVRWKLSSSPAQPPENVPQLAGVLIVGSEKRIAYRSAAALARAGNQPIYVFIPSDADERSRLYASALQSEEGPRGNDS